MNPENSDDKPDEYVASSSNNLHVSAAAYEDEFIISADLTGYKTEDITLRTNSTSVVIDVRISSLQFAEFLGQEVRQRDSQTTVNVPAQYNPYESTAEFNHGILVVKVPTA